jgi:Right handed beta helix region
MRWLLLGLTLLAVGAQGATYQVGTCGGVSATHASLSAALTTAGASGSNHTINLCAGTYSQPSILLTQSGHQGLTLQSVSGVASDVSLRSTSCSVGTVEVSVANVSLRGLTIVSTLSNCRGLQMNNNSGGFKGTSLVVDAKGDGINADGYVSTIDLTDVSVGSGQDDAISIRDTGTSVTLTRVTVTAAPDLGVYIEGRAGGAVITDLKVLQSSTGLQMNNVQNPRLEKGSSGNSINATGAGILLGGDTGAFKIYDTSVVNGSTTSHNGIQATGNNWGAWEIQRVVLKSRGMGIRVNGGQDPVLRDLSIDAGAQGIYLLSAQHPDIDAKSLSSNIIKSAQTGVWLAGTIGTFKVRNTQVTAGSFSSHHGIRAEMGWGSWVLSNNTVVSAGGHGLYVEQYTSGNGVISGNKVQAAGLKSLQLLEGAGGWLGVQVSGNCFYALPYNQDQNASYTVSSTGNFWGSSNSTGFSETCTDANTDGRCDTAYTVPGNPTRSDSRPFKAAPSGCGANAGVPPPSLNHLRISHSSGVGLTCTPSTLTVRACADATCTTAYTAGVSANLTSSRSDTLFPDGSAVAIPVGSSTVNLRVQQPNTSSITLGLGSVAPAPTGAVQCDFGSPGCTFRADDAGFLLTLPNHRSETSTTLKVAAVRKSDNSSACVPAFANVSRSVNYACSYNLPNTGTLPVRLGGFGLNATGSASVACSSRNVTSAFNANGEASLALLYADAGRYTVTASYTGSNANGDPGLSLTGSVSAVAVPTDFGISNLSTGVLTAGVPFNATVTARNSLGATTPNFGREGEQILLQLAKISPVGGGTQAGQFAGSAAVVNGVAAYTNLTWSEVGTASPLASLLSGNYLGTGLTFFGYAPGPDASTGALGPFRPHHFRVTAAPACGAFSYAGQPFTVTVTARSAQGTTTVNYSKGFTPVFARAHTFSDVAALGLGTLSPTGLAANDFTNGVATAQVRYAFAAKASCPGSLVLRSVDSDGVSSATLANMDATLPLRSGRLVLAGANGLSGQALALPLRLEYWLGGSNGSWVLAKDDACTSAPLLAGYPAATAQSGRVTASGVSTSSWSTPLAGLTLAQGVGELRLAAPTPASSGAVDVALNLGSTTTDRACLPTPRPSTVGLNLPWLRSRQGSLNGCGAREDSDPSSRATFGVHEASKQKKIHERQID